MSPLRQRLREETRPEHDALDAAFGALDLGKRADYVLFLKAHHAAHALIEPIIQPAPPRCAALAADLAVLKEDMAQGFSDPALATAQPLGLAYVVAGSHLGGQVLRRQWSSGQNATILAAGHYFSLTGLKDHWDAVLCNLSSESSRNEDIIAGAKAGFSCFAAALRFVRKDDA